MSQPVIVLGMHRSGTSYLSGLLSSMGVHIGQNLLAADSGNKHGYFENRSFLDFHCKMLHKYRPNDRILYDIDVFCESLFDLPLNDDELAEADRLIDENQRPGFWGWKDPRTCLFLDLWLKKLPNAKCVIIYRNPLDIYLSFLRRGDWEMYYNPSLVFHTYAAYYTKVLELYEKDSSRYLLINANSAFADLNRTKKELMDFLGLQENASQGLAEFYPDSFIGNESSEAQYELARRIMGHACRLFDKLQTLCGNPESFSTANREKDDLAKSTLDSMGAVFESSPIRQREGFIPIIDRCCLNVDYSEVQEFRDSILYSLKNNREEVRQEMIRLQDSSDRFEESQKTYHKLFLDYYHAYQDVTDRD